MKKLLLILLSLMLIGSMVVGVSGCGNISDEITNNVVGQTLDTPNGLRVENGCLCWNPVEYASKYTVSIDGREFYVEDYKYALEDVSNGEHVFKVKANGDGVIYKSSGWSLDYVVDLKDKAISKEYAYKDFENLSANESFLGYGFDVINSAHFSDKYVKTSFPIFNIDSLMQQRLVKVDSRLIHVDEIKSSSMEEYMQQWNANLNVNVGWDAMFSAGSVDIDLKYSGGVENAKSKYFHSISFYNQEFYIVLQSDMKTYRSILSDGFLTDLYSDMEPSILFDRYGTHFITSAVMGGRIDSHYLYTSEEEKSYNDISTSVSVNVRGWVVDTDVDVSVGYRDQALKENIYIKNTLDVIGGDNFGMMQDSDIAKNYLNWQKSLAQNASLMGIKDTGSLIPLWELIDTTKDTKKYTYTNSAGEEVTGSRSQQLQAYFEKYGLQAYNALLSNAKLPEIVVPNSIENVTVNNEYSDTGEYEVYAGTSNLIGFTVLPEKAVGYTKTASLSKETSYAKIDNQNGLALIIEANCPHNTVLNIVVGAGSVRKTINVRVIRRYTVTFESNGGTPVASYYNVRCNSQIDAPTPPTKEGKIFEGWYTTPNFSEGTKYLFGEIAIEDDLTLYAKWKDKNDSIYCITYNWNQGAPEETTYTQEYQGGNEIVLPTAVRNGYVFEGWYTDIGFKNIVDILDLSNNPRDIQLYAKWSKDKYAFSYSYDSSTNSYAVTGIGYVEDRDIEIPSYYKGIPVTTIAEGAFMNNANIISVVIGDLVTKIERDAFYCCVNLTRVVLGTSVNEMAWGGFLGLFPPFNTCYRLMEVCNKSSMNISSFPRSAKFSYCAPRIYTNENESKLVRTSDGFIKYVDGSVVELIGYIGEETNVVIPSDVTHLSVSFYENQNVKTVTLGKNVFSVGAYAFLKCTALSSFYIDSSNTSFSVVDGNLYDINGTTLVKYAIGKLDKEYVMPDGVKNIQDYAFSHGKYLESIEADNLENIGEYAFCNCEKLKTVDIYCNTLFIGEYAFSGCTALTSVKFMQTAFTSVTFMTVSNGGSEPKKIIVLAPETNAKNLSETYSSYCWEYNI